MYERSTSITLHFSQPVKVPGISDLQPAGDYLVTVDEELLEGLSFLAYRRTAASIQVQTSTRAPHSIQVIPLSTDELDTLVGISTTAIV